MERIGDLFKNLPVVKQVVKEVGAPSPSQEKLLDAAAAIRLDPDKVEAAYMRRRHETEFKAR